MSMMAVLKLQGLRRFFYETREGLDRMQSVVFALIFKEFKNRQGRDNRLGMLWLMIDPIMLTIVMTVVWTIMGRAVMSGINVALFIAAGTAPYEVFMLGIGSVPRSLKTNRIFYNYQQVKPFDAVLAEFVLEFTLVICGLLALFIILWWFFDLEIIYRNALTLMAIMALAAITAFGVALFIGTYGTLYEPVSRATQILSRGFLFATPIFYPAYSLPDDLRYYLSWNPASHLVELARFYALGIKPFPEASWTYVNYVALFSLFMGLVAYFPNRQRFLKT